MADGTPRGPDDLITSPTNPTIKLARSLHRKRVRHRERAMLVEGIRAIRSACDLGVPIKALLIDAARAPEFDSVLIDRLRRQAGRVLRVESGLFQQIADTEHPQALIAICELPSTPLPIDSTFVVVLDGVRDPGNLGTLIRSSAAAGADGVALLHGSVDPSNPKAVRASAGSIFALPVQPFGTIAEIADQCFLKRPTIVLADADGDRPYDAVDWALPSMLVIGGEAEGAGLEARTYADVVASIPMASGPESLNAAIAGAIIAFEVARQRRVDR